MTFNVSMSEANPRIGRLLLTGAAGSIGTALRPFLADFCDELRLVDRIPVSDVRARESAHTIELADIARHDHIMANVDAIVHLAGHPSEADWATLIPSNIVATAALWDMACRHGVGRIIHASSNHAVGLYPRTVKIDHAVPLRPDSRYGVTKAFMETLAAMYAFKSGIRAFGIRIGHCTLEPSDNRMLSHWVHPEDLAALVRIGLTADYVCEVVYGVSDNSRSWWDNRRAHELGYRPRHSADPFIDALESRRSPDPLSERYQGGDYAAREHAAGSIIADPAARPG